MTSPGVILPEPRNRRMPRPARVRLHVLRSRPEGVGELPVAAPVAECVEGFRASMDLNFDCIAEAYRAASLKLEGCRRSFAEALLAIIEDRTASAILRQQAGFDIARLTK